MNLFLYYTDRVRQVIQDLMVEGALPSPLDLSRVTLEAPRDVSHGDLACNAAMVLAKPANLPPRQLAELLIVAFQKIPEFVRVEIAGPGFINITLAPQVLQDHLTVILEKGSHYGNAALGQGQAINVEYVSANPTGPMHVGHCRNAVFGDILANLFEKVGYKVTREYYINDAGGQVTAFARSVYLRYKEALGATIAKSDFTEDMYSADYLVPIGKTLAQKYGDRWLDQPEEAWLTLFRGESIQVMTDQIREDLKALGITMDVFSFESAIVSTSLLTDIVKQLEQQGDIYVGVLEPPKGHVIEDWEARPQTLFRATHYGDDVDRPLKKSDGNWTYFAGDIAYHVDKFRRGFAQMINVFGADHAGYIKRLQAAVTAATQGQGHVEIKATQLVNLFENGQPFKMSKRAGTFIRLRDVVDRVGKDATRFMMVTRRHDVPIDFDFAKVLEQTRENPIFYVQYAHARACSVLRHAAELALLTKGDFRLLTDVAELGMIKQLAEWPKQVEGAVMTREPHRIANYLLDVAAGFHGLWNKGKEDVQLRFIDPAAPALTQARLGLVQAVTQVIANGLYVLGVTPLQEMH